MSDDKCATEGCYGVAAKGNKCTLCTLDAALVEAAAQRERADRAEAKAEQYERDWYAAKSEFGDAMVKMSEKERAAQARVAEMERRITALADEYGRGCGVDGCINERCEANADISASLRALLSPSPAARPAASEPESQEST